MYEKTYNRYSFRTVLCIIGLLLYMPVYTADQEVFDFFDSDVDLNVKAMCQNVDPVDVVDFLIAELDALCILQQNFYLRTNELNQRNLLDYGIFLPQKFYNKPFEFGAHFFYNATTRDNYTRTSTKLCSYLAIFQETLLQELQKRISNLIDTPIDLTAVVPLFRNMTVQERRTGFMFHGLRRWGPYRFRFMIPFYYNEANFFLTPEELDAIEDRMGITDPAEDLNFARKHLIADKLGFGDLRLNLDFPLPYNGPVTMKIGLQSTIPVAFAIKKGLYGSYFRKRCTGPVLDFCDIFDLAVNEQDFAALQTIGEQFAFAALNHFAANLIETPMGNGGHFGLGAYTRTKTPLTTVIKRPWAEHISINSRMSIEYLFPKTQRRYFIETSSQPQFAALGLDRPPSVILEQVENDPAYARTVLAFLEQQFTNKIFPFALLAKVRPGVIFRWMTKYMYEAQRWGYFIGTDTWITSRERLYNIHIPRDIPPLLNKKIAQKPFGYQVGVMGNVFWKLEKNWLLSANIEYNFASTGIGHDYVLTFNFEHLF